MSSADLQRTGRGLMGNSIALLAMTYITCLLGYVFWTACARGVSASAVGVTTTVISTMTLAAVLAAAGLEPLLTRLLPGAEAEERSGLCSTALVATAVVSALAGVLGALLLPEPIEAMVGTGWLIGLLATGAMGTALLLVINAALLGVRRAEFSLVGSTVASLLRLVAVVVLLGWGITSVGADPTAARALLLIWVASLMVSFGLSVRLLVRATPGLRFRPGFAWLSRLRQEIAWDHIATLGARTPDYAVPIAASGLLPPAQVGYLAIAWMINTAFQAVSTSVSHALLAECADRPGLIRAQARRALRMIGALLIPAVAVAGLAAPLILGLFGADYAERGRLLLVLLLLCTLPDAVLNLSVTILRVQRRLAAAAVITVTAAILTLGGAWLLIPRLGISGAGWAALGAASIVALGIGVFARRLTPAAGSGGGEVQETPQPVPGGAAVRTALVATPSPLPCLEITRVEKVRRI